MPQSQQISLASKTDLERRLRDLERRVAALETGTTRQIDLTSARKLHFTKGRLTDVN